MKRRRVLILALTGTAGGLAGAGWWLNGAPNPVTRIPDLTAARQWLAQLQAASTVSSRTAWSVPQVLAHLAQSIEYSMTGYPEAKPVWFQASAGRLANSVFQRAGSMRHDLQAPIPGAPALGEPSIGAAAQRLSAALDTFERFEGRLMAHFAYGELDHSAYLRAHLMHIANHAEEIELHG